MKVWHVMAEQANGTRMEDECIIFRYICLCFCLLFPLIRSRDDRPPASGTWDTSLRAGEGVVDGTERGAGAWMKFGILDYGQSLHCILAALFCFYLDLIMFQHEIPHSARKRVRAAKGVGGAA